MKKANRSQAKAVQSQVSNKHVHRLEKKNKKTKKLTQVFSQRGGKKKKKMELKAPVIPPSGALSSHWHR